MEEDLKNISDNWRDKYSRRLKKYRPFEISEDFKKYVSLFAPGNSYFYIVNLQNMNLDYVSDSVSQFVSCPSNELTLQDLLRTVIPEDVKLLSLKSQVVSDFYISYLNQGESLYYKNMFNYRMKCVDGKIKMVLYQAFPLSVSEDGTPEHVFCIHTDVSHLTMTSINTVSFIHMDGGRSYLNIDPSKGRFSPKSADNELNQLSAREKQIVIHLSKGLNADQISKKLNLSHHTIKAHRRNILQKTGCNNTTELVAKCLINGIITPN